MSKTEKRPKAKEIKAEKPVLSGETVGDETTAGQ